MLLAMRLMILTLYLDHLRCRFGMYDGRILTSIVWHIDHDDYDQD